MHDNPYIFGDPDTDRDRLETQSYLFSNYLRANMVSVIGKNIQRILDIGCGEGQLARVMRELYPGATLMGIDKDERAIALAKQRAEDQGLRDIEYVVGDVEQGLPEGPFDLIFSSFLLIHTRQPHRVIQFAYEALNPGGYLWIKDLDPSWATAINLRSYTKAVELVNSALTAVGGNPFLVRQLPDLLQAAGFVDIHAIENETYALGGATPEGRAMLAIVLGVIYNARGMVSRVHKIPESEIERLYLDVCNAALRTDKELGVERIANYTARHPPK